MNVAAFWGAISSAGFFMATAHAQDFKDVAGDMAIGRTTLPIAFPCLSRVSMLVLVPVCTVVICHLWAPPIPFRAILLTLSVFVGSRYVMYTDINSDKVSYLWYNVRKALFWLLAT